MEENVRLKQLSEFAAKAEAIVPSRSFVAKTYFRRGGTITYTLEEVINIIKTGTINEKIQLSQHFFKNNGYYNKIITYYATLLKYAHMLIPHVSYSKSLSEKAISKRYRNCVDFIENNKLQSIWETCILTALVDGTYYGLLADSDDNRFVLIDLPTQYCRTRANDIYGRPIVEFNLAYFSQYSEEATLEAVLAAFPKAVRKAYKQYRKTGTAGKATVSEVVGWFPIPSDLTVCFKGTNYGNPCLLSILEPIVGYAEDSNLVAEALQDQVEKIIVQQIPHLSDGRLLFEPDEAEVIHKGTKSMLSGNKRVSVLTSYADVDSITASSLNDNLDDFLTREEQNIYAAAGVSNMVFAPTNSGAVDISLKTDLAYVMHFAYQISKTFTDLLNRKFGNSSISFNYLILPISYFNQSDYVTDALKLASSGYSLLLPSIALDLSQRDLLDVKSLENDLLDLTKHLIPPSTSYTQGGDSSAGGTDKKQGLDPKVIDPDVGGRPQKEIKSEKTIERKEYAGQ